MSYQRNNYLRKRHRWTESDIRMGIRSVCLCADPPMGVVEYEALRKTDPGNLPSAATAIKYLAPGQGWGNALEAAGCPRRCRGRHGHTKYLMDNL